jgi:hypothetical protein
MGRDNARRFFVSKLKCICDNIISNSVSPSPTEGMIIGQKSFDSVQEQFVAEVSKYLESIKAQDKADYLKTTFSVDYPVDMIDAEVIEDIRNLIFNKKVKSIAECSSCGRLWMQKTVEKNDYVSFEPDNKIYNSILDS